MPMKEIWLCPPRKNWPDEISLVSCKSIPSATTFLKQSAVAKHWSVYEGFLQSNARTIVGVNHHSQPDFAFVVKTNASSMIQDGVE